MGIGKGSGSGDRAGVMEAISDGIKMTLNFINSWSQIKSNFLLAFYVELQKQFSYKI